jgi:hypothetical protein
MKRSCFRIPPLLILVMMFVASISHPLSATDVDREGNGIVRLTQTNKVKVPRSGNATSTVKSCETGQCYSYWQELTHPHDATYQGRLKAQKAYNDCLLRCKAAPQTRQ